MTLTLHFCSFLAAAWLVLSAAPIAAADDRAARTPAASGRITILHTNDIHGHLTPWTGWEGELAGQTVGGMDRIAARVEAVRREVGREHVLLLDGGDTLGDTLIAAETKGRALIEAMNAMRYDAMVIGNHEPDFTADTLASRMREAAFPMLAANIVKRDGKLFTRPYVLRTVGGVRVGIVGIAYPNTPLTTAKRNVEGLQFLHAVETARRYVPRMRREGARIVIALTHLGLNADKALAEAVDGIDVIVGGHSHNRMSEPLRVRETLIVHAGAHGSDLGRLDLSVDRGRVVSHRRTLIPVTGDIAPDPVVAAVVARHRRAFESQISEKLGVAGTVLPRAQTLAGQEPEPRDRESPVDSLFADAIRAETGAEIAFLPGVGYGVAVQPGDITAEQLRNLIPHDAAVWTMTLDGRQIREVLEQSVENVTTSDAEKKVGGMIQVSGLRFSYDPAEAFGGRVRDVEVAGRPIDEAARYRVAVNALLAEGGHRYKTLLRGHDRALTGKQYEMVKGWLARRGQVAAPTVPRITRVSPPQ